MVLVPDKNVFMDEVIQLTDNADTIEQLEVLYGHIKGYSKITNPKVVVENIIRDIFAVPFLKDVLIPFKFMKTSIGKMIFAVYFGSDDMLYSVNDIVEFTKTEKRPRGYSTKTVHKDIKVNGILKGTMRNGAYEFTKEEVNEYLAKKGLPAIK